MKKGITVVCSGFNEERRANDFFKSISMFDEVVFANRGSTDMTCEIAGKYSNVKIMDIPHNPPETEHLVVLEYMDKVYKMASHEWIINLSFADIVHPKLYDKLIKIIYKENFRYDMVKVSWVEYLFGFEDEYIPRCHYNRPILCKKDSLRLSIRAHHEINTDNIRIYTMKKDKVVAVHHMTYFNLQYSFKEQHVRYAINEYVSYYAQCKRPVKELFGNMRKEILAYGKLIIEGIRNKRGCKVFITGVMIFIYREIEYYLMIYLIIWSKSRQNLVNDIFEEIYIELKETEKRRKVPFKQLFKMWKNVCMRMTTGIGANLLALFAIVNIVGIMNVLYIWDNMQHETAQEKYDKLKNKILSDV